MAQSIPVPLLGIDNLSIEFGGKRVVDDFSLSISAGEKVGLVGESGSGKSVTALAILRLLDAATYQGHDPLRQDSLLTQSERWMRGLRGRDIAMIFQEPMTALDPLYTIGNQIGEVLELHEGLRPNAARARSIELLRRTGIPESAAPRRFVSAPALRRTAPARHDRDGTRLPAEAADRR